MLQGNKQGSVWCGLRGAGGVRREDHREESLCWMRERSITKQGNKLDRASVNCLSHMDTHTHANTNTYTRTHAFTNTQHTTHLHTHRGVHVFCVCVGVVRWLSG